MFSQWKREKESIKWALDELNYITDIFFFERQLFLVNYVFVIRLDVTC
jgi:hypothetical protein